MDGDTLDLEVDLGFGVFRKLRVRLADVDAPAIDTAKGRKARDFVAREMMGASTVAVKTIKVDLHGWYVVHLFHMSRRASLGRCFSGGNYLNDSLLQEKLARLMPSG